MKMFHAKLLVDLTEFDRHAKAGDVVEVTEVFNDTNLALIKTAGGREGYIHPNMIERLPLQNCKYVELDLHRQGYDFTITRFEIHPRGQGRTYGVPRKYTPTKASIKRMEDILEEHRHGIDELRIGLQYFPSVDFYFENR